MAYDAKSVQAHWDREDVESMYDKHLLSSEIALIKEHIAPGSRVLDVGCGEGEGTLVYSSIPQVTVCGIDFSATRLAKARQRLGGRANVTLQTQDILQPLKVEGLFNAIVSQRCLINITDSLLQQAALKNLGTSLKPGGKFILLEGSVQGVDELNRFRAVMKLPPIPVQWHNRFFDDGELRAFMSGEGYELVHEDGIGEYLLLTRGIRPLLDDTLNWDSPFNELAAQRELRGLLNLGSRFSRLKLTVFVKHRS